jgi:hypothetical protein
MPLIETRGSGSAFAYGLTTGSGFDDMFKPAGTSRILGLSFNEGLLTKTSDSTLTVTTTTASPTLNAAGGVAKGFASGFAMGAGSSNLTAGTSLIVSDLPTINGVNLTFIAWYKGTQTTTATDVQRYSAPVPIFGDPRGSVYVGFGIDKGKIYMGETGGSRGGPNINDGNWHMLAWTVNSSIT